MEEPAHPQLYLVLRANAPEALARLLDAVPAACARLDMPGAGEAEIGRMNSGQFNAFAAALQSLPGLSGGVTGKKKLDPGGWLRIRWKKGSKSGVVRVFSEEPGRVTAMLDALNAALTKPQRVGRLKR